MAGTCQALLLTHSGTNGYVQRNLSHIRPRDPIPTRNDDKKVITRPTQPDAAILEHERKRKIEIQCIELQDKLEDEGCVHMI